MKEKIVENLERIRSSVADACRRARRESDEVRLIGVTKTVELSIIRLLMELGLMELGESKVQELIEREASIKETISGRLELLQGARGEEPVRPRWHMIGHLQRNKVKQLLPVVDYIHSVDSLRLAEEINTAAARLGLNDKVKIFLQVNTSQEKQKYGLAVGAVTALAEQVETLPNIKIVGLMTMTPLGGDQDVCRSCFVRLREIFAEIRGGRVCGPYFRHLSMGMSQDYITAVEEGATMIRIGTALFEGA